MHSSLTIAAAALAALASAQNQIQIIYDNNACDNPQNYAIYYYPGNTEHATCITFGAPGFPDTPGPNNATACISCTDEGGNCGDCNAYPQYAMSVVTSVFDGQLFSCDFYDTEDCNLNDPETGYALGTVHAQANMNTCVNIPPHLPISSQQSALSMTCYPSS